MASTITAAGSLPPEALGRLRKQAEELEGIFLNTLMKEMFASLGKQDESLGGGFATETWRGMQAEQLADAVARSGGIGLADSLMPDLIALQEAHQNTPAFASAGSYLK